MTLRERHSQPAPMLNEITDTGCRGAMSSPQLLLLCRQHGFHVNSESLSPSKGKKDITFDLSSRRKCSGNEEEVEVTKWKLILLVELMSWVECC